MTGSTSDTASPSLARRARRELRVFPRQFWLLTFGFFVLLAGVDMCFPFETIYLRQRMDVSMTTIGLLLGVPLLAALPLHIVGGAFADRYGRKPAMAIGVVVLAALYCTFAFATEIWQIGIAITVEAGFGWALFLTGSNAMTADLVPHERRAEAYSITRVALNAGMVLGPLMAGVLLATSGGFRTLFLTGGAISAVFVLIVLVFFRETRPEAARRQATLAATLSGYAAVMRDGRFLAFCGVALLPLYGFGQIWSVWPVALAEVHGISPRTWSVVLASYALASFLFQYPVVRVLRRRDHLLLMAASSAALGVGLAGGVLAPWGYPWPTLVFVLILSFAIMLLIPISATVAAELAPVALRGRYMGAWTLVQMGGYALGPLFGGWALDGLGPRSAFTLVGALGLLGAALFVITASHFRRVDEEAAEAAREALVDGESYSTVPPGI